MQQAKLIQYFAQNPDLRVLFVFDPSGLRLDEVAGFSWGPPYEVVRFKGDWFATKCRIADLKADERMILLMQLDPPLENDERMQNFPLLGELCANAQYADEDYRTFMALRGLPESATGFVRSHLSDLQVGKFDKVLSPHYDANFTRDIGVRGILSGLLDESSLREWREIFVRLFVLAAEDPATSRKRDLFFRKLLLDARYEDVKTALQEKLRQTFGAELEPNEPLHLKRVAMTMRYNSMAQELPTSNADNYKSYRVTDGVVIGRMNEFLRYVSELQEARREVFLTAYAELAKEIRESHLVDVYGVDADYRAYPPKLCAAILGNLAGGDVAKNAAGVSAKAERLAGRVEAGEAMRTVAAFLKAAASVYVAFGKIKTFKLNTPEAFVSAYAEEWHAVDRAYRLAVEAYYAIVDDGGRGLVEAAKRRLDVDYSVRVNDMNAAWMESLRKAGGTQKMSGVLLQQKLYLQIGDPSTKHVVIVSDGLRYEVAKEVEELVNAGRHKAILKPALAMLPSETCYCKPVLLPHERAALGTDGTPETKIDGYSVREMRKRGEVLSNFGEDADCLSVSDLQKMTQTEGRELFKRKLVYVYHDSIDGASHGKSAKESVDACRKTVEDLARLIHSIHSTYNVNDILLTSDHGFLLDDIAFEEKDKIPVPSTENAEETKTRYYLTRSAASEPGVSKFPLKAVSEMDSDLLVAVPDGTKRFAAAGGYAYAHGGASLQEIVIPVLRSTCLRPDVRQKVSLSVVGDKLQVLSSQFKVNLLQNEKVTADVQARTVKCGLYANGKLVSEERTVTFDFMAGSPTERIRTVELTAVGSMGTGILQFKVFDEGDLTNPLICREVTNCTLVERDF